MARSLGKKLILSMLSRPPSDYRVFGRFTSRLGVQDRLCLEAQLPRFTFAIPTDGALIDPAHLFSHNPEDIWLEIGFGQGEHLLAQARQYPSVGLIGCEPFVKGICQVVRSIVAEEIDTIRIFPHHALLFLRHLKRSSIGRLFIFFPDPWPKKRHEKRRFLSEKTVGLCAHVLKMGGQLLLASDSEAYLTWAKDQINAVPSLQLQQESETPPQGWVPTKYQKKAQAQGRKCTFFTFVKKV